MKYLAPLAAIFLLFALAACKEPQYNKGNRSYVVNGYGKVEYERLEYRDAASPWVNDEPYKYHEISGGHYTWNHPERQAKIDARIQYLENEAARKGVNRDHYVDYWLSESECNSSSH